ncbi:nucleotidyl transferase AbiEii/AbiGii toxin family protein [Rhodocista pekingensis]|uniref:Nucleotidyl transferase AbiEii/AbiGii toxin family protein n=1 Tax=Rhodocista pekingensis TaxID=201185 RepID=A0ABW2KZ31_9PROT
MSDPRYDLGAVQDFFGFSGVSVVEKDLEIVKVLKIFSELKTDGVRFVFAGGTCLARAHGRIKRMSEDLDIKLVLSPGLAAAGATKQRKVLSTLKEALIQEFGRVGLHLDHTEAEADEPPLLARNENRHVSYRLTYDRATKDASILDPRIRIETVVSVLRRAAELRPVSSLAAEAYGQPAEVAGIACVSIAETAAEKIVSLTRRIAARLEGDAGRFDNRIIRHVYDLHMIRDSIDPGDVGSMAREIAGQDAVQFRNRHPGYADDPEEATRRALDALVKDPEHGRQYDAFMTDMVYGDRIGFDVAMRTVAEIAAAMWGWDATNTAGSGRGP